MTTASFTQVVEEVQALSPADQEQLRAWLALRGMPTPLTEDTFAAALCVMGLLSVVKPSLPPCTSAPHGEPIPTTGPPLSDIIVAERR